MAAVMSAVTHTSVPASDAWKVGEVQEFFFFLDKGQWLLSTSEAAPCYNNSNSDIKIIVYATSHEWAIPFNKDTPLLRKLIMSIQSKYGQINEVQGVLFEIMSKGIFQN